jgi:hypothetical protein
MNEWKIEDEKTLREKVESGMRFRSIGKLIGKTKNACIGKAHRLGLLIKVKKGAMFKPPKPKPKPAPPKPPEAFPVIAIAPHRDGGGVEMIDLKLWNCRWIFDDKTYCGRLHASGSYCKDHAAIVYRPLEKSYASTRHYLHRLR